MATLLPFFSSRHQVGKNQEIWAQIPIFQHIGNGKFSALSEYDADFTGSATVLGHVLTFALSISLDDQNAAANSGPCTTVFNGNTQNLRYTVVNGELHLTGSLDIVIKRVEGGDQTAIEVKNEPAVHLKQYP